MLGFLRTFNMEVCTAHGQEGGIVCCVPQIHLYNRKISETTI